MVCNRKKTSIILLLTLGFTLAFLVFGYSSCQKKAKDSEAYILARTEYEADRQNPSKIQTLMYLQLMEKDRPDLVIDLYDSSQEWLGDSVMAKVLYATALCKKAGISETPTEQLRYVRRGMGEFDKLRRDHPDNGSVLMWQAITYSNFPEILGADQIVDETINRANELHASGAWNFERGELEQLTKAYINLARTFNNRNYLAKAQTQAVKHNLDADPVIADLLSTLAQELK